MHISIHRSYHTLNQSNLPGYITNQRPKKPSTRSEMKNTSPTQPYQTSQAHNPKVSTKNLEHRHPSIPSSLFLPLHALSFHTCPPNAIRRSLLRLLNVSSTSRGNANSRVRDKGVVFWIKDTRARAHRSDSILPMQRAQS